MYRQNPTAQFTIEDNTVFFSVLALIVAAVLLGTLAFVLLEALAFGNLRGEHGARVSDGTWYRCARQEEEEEEEDEEEEETQTWSGQQPAVAGMPAWRRHGKCQRWIQRVQFRLNGRSEDRLAMPHSVPPYSYIDWVRQQRLTPTEETPPVLETRGEDAERATRLETIEETEWERRGGGSAEETTS